MTSLRGTIRIRELIQQPICIYDQHDEEGTTCSFLAQELLPNQEIEEFQEFWAPTPGWIDDRLQAEASGKTWDSFSRLKEGWTYYFSR
jgi:hypothetical protein